MTVNLCDHRNSRLAPLKTRSLVLFPEKFTVLGITVHYPCGTRIKERRRDARFARGSCHLPDATLIPDSGQITRDFVLFQRRLVEPRQTGSPTENGLCAGAGKWRASEKRNNFKWSPHAMAHPYRPSILQRTGNTLAKQPTTPRRRRRRRFCPSFRRVRREAPFCIKSPLRV